MRRVLRILGNGVRWDIYQPATSGPWWDPRRTGTRLSRKLKKRLMADAFREAVRRVDVVRVE